MTAVVLTELSAREIAFHAIGEVEMDMVMYELALGEKEEFTR